MSLLIRFFIIFTVMRQLHFLSKQETVTQHELQPFLFYTLILTIITFIICYVAAFGAFAMSFDGGPPGITIYIATAVMAISPIVFQLIPLILAWIHVRNNRTKQAITLLKINWWSVTVVMIAFLLGLMVLLCKMLPDMMR